MNSVGGNYHALRDYPMINGGMFKNITKINAKAIKELQPKISVWSNGGRRALDGAGTESVAIKEIEIASIYRRNKIIAHP